MSRASLLAENLALRQRLDVRHLLRLLKRYVEYSNASRMHLSLEKVAPLDRDVQVPLLGGVVAIPQVGGLRHRHERRAA